MPFLYSRLCQGSISISMTTAEPSSIRMERSLPTSMPPREKLWPRWAMPPAIFAAAPLAGAWQFLSGARKAQSLNCQPR
jgi:hypothetical protein